MAKFPHDLVSHALTLEFTSSADGETFPQELVVRANDLRRKVAQDQMFSPLSTHPGVAPMGPSGNDATHVIWQDPSSYNPYFHGPPYLPGMQVRVPVRPVQGSTRTGNEPQSPATELGQILVALRALAVIHQTSHWQVVGKQFYGDHLLYERLYNDVVGEIDQVAERAVGLGDSLVVDPVTQMSAVSNVVSKLVSLFNVEGTSFETLGARSWGSEKWFVGLVKSLAEQMKNQGTLSRGTDNLLAGIEDKHEEHLYLLKHRNILASKVDPGAK